MNHLPRGWMKPEHLQAWAAELQRILPQDAEVLVKVEPPWSDQMEFHVQFLAGNHTVGYLVNMFDAWKLSQAHPGLTSHKKLAEWFFHVWDTRKAILQMKP